MTRRTAGARARGKALGCLIGALCLPGCAGLTSMAPRDGAARRSGPLPVAGTALFDWKGMVHCHSYLSHDSDGAVAAIEAASKLAGMDFVVMTDHQTDASIRDGIRGMRGATLFVVGAEIRTPQGTVLAFPLQRPLRRWMHAAALAAEADEQGAILLIGHAEQWRDWRVPGPVGVEILNLHAAARADHPAGLLATGLLRPSRALMERLCTPDPTVLAAWDARLLHAHPFAPVGGGDAHANIQLFGPLGGTVADYPDVFLTLSTHVLAASLDEGSLVEAIRRGRTYVALDARGEGSGFDFRAVRGGELWLPGDSMPAAPDLELRVTTPRAAQIRLLRDGVVAAQTQGTDLRLLAPAPGVYRVEAATSAGEPWILSGSLRVQP